MAAGRGGKAEVTSGRLPVRTMAAAAVSPARKRLDLRDSAALFETHGTEEIRGLERQVRAEIEHKKEELRQMVGERYRDLIEAADTIGQMRCCAEGLVDAVQATDQYCARLRQAGPPAPPRPPQAPQLPQLSEKFYSMAAQIKLLLDIPERIWSSMEASQYLRATQLHLLCCHLHGLLQLEPGAPCHSPVLSRFPILIRQVAAASHFRSTILYESKMLLKGQAVSDQAVAEALCSIMLLEESSPRQALTDFLMARKAAFQKLLNQPQHGSGIKAQICSLVELLATTLNQAHVLFYTMPEGQLPEPALPCGLLFSTLEAITGHSPAGTGAGVLQGELQSCGWFKHLPASIMHFQPALRTLVHPISQEYLRDTLQKWIHMCKEDIKNGISNLLLYVKSMRGLAGIRDAVWELLAHGAANHSWDVICRRLLEKPLSLWEDMLQQLFLERLQTLTKEGFDSISSSSKELLGAALQELGSPGGSASHKHIHYEQNMALFLWSESASDLPSDAAWVTVANRAQFAHSGLSMKAQAVSPCVQNFCSALDSRLKMQLDDLLAYLPSDEPSPPRDGPQPQAKGPAFDRYADAGTVQDMLQAHAVACIRHIMDCIQAELRSTEEAVQGRQASHSQARLHAVLFMARLCQSLGELCPHLKQCIVGNSRSPETPAREARVLKKATKGNSQDGIPAQAKWQEVREMLLQQSVLGYRTWSTTVVKVLTDGFTQSLLSEDAGSILATATNWDELEIQEETESGSSITSKIRLPTQPSWYVQSFLFSLCQEINRVGGHALPKVTLQEMLQSCRVQVVAAYERFSEEKTKKEGAFPVTQNRALQLLYDLRYLSLVLTTKGEEGKSGRSKPDPRLEKVTDHLEGLIDPFDLDVFTPHLNNNLSRLVQRTSVLFGLITATDNQFTSRSSTFLSQEPHNILPLASTQMRFGLLPLSMTSNRKARLSRSIQTQAQQADPPAPSAAEDSMHAGSLFRQLVNEEDDTATPSLFKLGWLSSMTK